MWSTNAAESRVLASDSRLTGITSDHLTPARAVPGFARPLDLTPARAVPGFARPLDLTPARAVPGFARPLDITPASMAPPR